MDISPWHLDVVTPTLLRHARSTYGIAMRAALDAAGFDDIPRNGLYVIGGLATGTPDVPLGALIRDLRISRQSAGQLVDTLVARGYLERTVDAHDRRKLNITLTERGLAAAAAQAGARRRIDQTLVDRIGLEAVMIMRQGLAALTDLGRNEGGEEDDG